MMIFKPEKVDSRGGFNRDNKEERAYKAILSSHLTP